MNKTPSRIFIHLSRGPCWLEVLGPILRTFLCNFHCEADFSKAENWTGIKFQNIFITSHCSFQRSPSWMHHKLRAKPQRGNVMQPAVIKWWWDIRFILSPLLNTQIGLFLTRYAEHCPHEQQSGPNYCIPKHIDRGLSGRRNRHLIYVETREISWKKRRSGFYAWRKVNKNPI